MLDSLSIRDFVLIERLDISFDSGLAILTGETGAGKSILLDAVGLASGARGDVSLVRRGARRASVTAEFSLPPGHPVGAILAENAVEAENGRVVLRRTVSAEGKSRAYVNDQAVSVGLLRRLGETLVEVHGQHDDRGLLDPAGHRALVDAFGGHGEAVEAVAATHGALQAAEAELTAARGALEAARRDEEYDRHACEELAALKPEAGEEEALAAARQLMMQGEKSSLLLDEITEILEQDGGIDTILNGVLRRLERTDETVRGHLEGAIGALERAAIEAGEGIAALAEARRALEFDPGRLEATEERLFALRALARKHNCRVDDLLAKLEEFSARLGSLDAGEERLAALETEAAACRGRFEAAVGALSEARRKAAAALDQAVNGELPDLRLEKARFRTTIAPLPAEDWTAAGGERLAFEVATLAGADFGPLKKIASGGELARFILALKVALAGAGTAPSLIFDEVDRGIGGAVADAVGVRLARLARDVQVLVVTHSPQVAARADQHWRVSKLESGEGAEAVTTARIAKLTSDERGEEIARMLSGADITDEARAAARSLMREAG